MSIEVNVSVDWLIQVHRDLDACQKVIWANLRGCDPSYYEDAQERLREINAMLAAAPAASAADAGLVEALRKIMEAHRFNAAGMSVTKVHSICFDALATHRSKGVA